MRRPDHYLGVRGATVRRAGRADPGGLPTRCSCDERPDAVLVLGDTNSGLCSIVAKRMGIPVYHMEAGNRCYDDRVPEEVNRRVIDHSSTVLMPYTAAQQGEPAARGHRGAAHLRDRQSHPRGADALRRADRGVSRCIERLGLERDGYFLVTMHRAENVDVEARLERLTQGARPRCEQRYGLPVVCSLHPRTRDKMQGFGVDARARATSATSSRSACSTSSRWSGTRRCVLSDSGTVQEECCIFRVPTVTLRDVTERPETIECGSNMLAGADPDASSPAWRRCSIAAARLEPPPEYLVRDVSTTVAKIVLGYRHATE